MTINDLARDVNFSAMPEAYAHIQEKFPENADAFYNYCIENIDELLSLTDSSAFQVGNAFYHLLCKMQEPSATDILNGEDHTKFNFCLASAVVCYHQAMEMCTVQSGIAASHLFDLIKRFQSSFTTYTLALTDEYLKSIFDKVESILALKPIEGDAITKAKRRLNIMAYYVVEYSKLDNWRGADMNLLKVGNLYLEALQYELRTRYNGFKLFGFFS
jgi:hypothetical protein